MAKMSRSIREPTGLKHGITQNSSFYTLNPRPSRHSLYTRMLCGTKKNKPHRASGTKGSKLQAASSQGWAEEAVSSSTPNALLHRHTLHRAEGPFCFYFCAVLTKTSANS